MKRLLIVPFIFLCIFGCTSEEKNMTLTGEVIGLKKGTLLLQKFEDTLLVSVDSLEINGNSEFSFSDNIISPEVYFLYLRLENGKLLDDRIAFFAEPGELEIITTLDNFSIDAQITGSKNQESFKEYQKIMQRYINKKLELVQKRFEAKQSGNDSLLISIERQEKALLSSKYLATINYAINHKELELAPYLVLTETYDTNIKYLDTVYNVLTPKVKDSKYGKVLESFIKDRKMMDTL